MSASLVFPEEPSSLGGSRMEENILELAYQPWLTEGYDPEEALWAAAWEVATPRAGEP